ncbi:MAG: hypothetical protein AAFO75_14250, partial [Pseudomonadota bacterium]
DRPCVRCAKLASVLEVVLTKRDIVCAALKDLSEQVTSSEPVSTGGCSKDLCAAVGHNLHQHLGRYPTATSALFAWCLAHDIGRGPIRAVTEYNPRFGDRGTKSTRMLDKDLRPSVPHTSFESRPRVRCRRVRLTRGNDTLSHATLTYRPAVLPADVLEHLRTTDEPFGSLIADLLPYRRMTFCRIVSPCERGTPSRLPNRDAVVLVHHATVYNGDGVAMARVQEHYLGTLILGVLAAQDGLAI